MDYIKLTEKQIEYIRARVHVDKVFFKYGKLLGEYEDVWQNDIQGFMKMVEKARKITGLDQAKERLGRIRKELTDADNMELLNNIVSPTKGRMDYPSAKTVINVKHKEVNCPYFKRTGADRSRISQKTGSSCSR